jgi:hypothetical protein
MGIDSNNRFKCGLNRIEEKHVEFIADDKVKIFFFILLFFAYYLKKH